MNPALPPAGHTIDLALALVQRCRRRSPGNVTRVKPLLLVNADAVRPAVLLRCRNSWFVCCGYWLRIVALGSHGEGASYIGERRQRLRHRRNPRLTFRGRMVLRVGSTILRIIILGIDKVEIA